jgi:hypothetical protein
MPDAEAACKGPVYACRVGLSEELATMAAAAAGHAGPGETVAGILAAEPAAGARVYLCAYASNGRTTWLALDARGEPLADRAAVREAASIAALCEVAAEAAGGGDLGELRSQLVALRLRERPPGIDEAEEAALALERAVGAPPRVASPAYLDGVGAATLRLERALGETGPSPFAEAMKSAVGAVDSLAADVEAGYRLVLS